MEWHEAFTVFFRSIFARDQLLRRDCFQFQWGMEQGNTTDTQSLLLALSQFSFVVTLVATQSVLAYTKGLSVKLQGAYVDVARGH